MLAAATIEFIVKLTEPLVMSKRLNILYTLNIVYYDMMTNINSVSSNSTVKPNPMAKLFINFILMVSLISSSVFLVIPSITHENAYAQNNNWYVGKGAQENTYYTYNVQHHDTKQDKILLLFRSINL